MSVAAWVDETPISTAEVESRLARLRANDRAGSLPVADSREGRQLRRWVTQVVVVERLCAHLTPDSCSQPHRIPNAGRTNQSAVPAVLSRADAAALGSIVAAAWTNDPAVPQAAALVTTGVSIPGERLQRAAELSATDGGDAAWSSDQLLTSARLEAFARWLARETHERVRLETGYEHPGDASQPDNLHEH
jgi:[acyl-carrier-protein] S-malonyltransferase